MGKTNKKKLFALVGMAGSGKSEAISYFQTKHHWPKVYFGEVTFDRIKEQNLELNYENERRVREQIRQELGMGAYAKLSLPKIETALDQSAVVLIESLYSWEEYKIIKEEYPQIFKVIAVYASPATRLSRMMKRKNWRPIKDEAELNKRDWTEIEGTDKGGPIAIADYTAINESTMKNFHMQLDEIIKKEGL